MSRITDGVTRTVLDNGLTVLVKENHSAPVVAIHTYVKAGYFNEADRVAGISHLIEHMFFKGTARRPAAEIATETKELGGYLNAATIYDHTVYYTVLPSKHFVQGLDIQSDALIHSVFDPDALEKETEVVIEEAKRKLDMPAAMAQEKLFELAFRKHRIRRWRIGTEEGLRALTRADLLAFHSHLYRPENIVLTVVGDIDTGSAQREIAKYYGSFDKGELLKEDSPPEPPQQAFQYRLLSGNIQQCYLALGFHVPDLFNSDSYALEILGIILGQGRSSRLFQSVKEDQGLAKEISASNYALQGLGLFQIFAVTLPETVRQAVLAIAGELGVLLATPVTEDELRKAQNLLLASYTRRLETVSGQASTLASYEAMGGYRRLDEYMRGLNQVTSQDILRVVLRYLVPQNMSVLEYVPDELQLEPLSVAELEKCIATKIPTGEAADATAEEVASPGPFVVLPAAEGNNQVELKILSNGMRLLVKENHSVPLIASGIFALGGRPDEDRQSAGISTLMAKSALRGTERRSAARVAAEIEQLGSSINFVAEADYFSCTMTTISSHFDAGWDVLSDVLCHPVFPASEVEKEKHDMLARLDRQRDDMFHYPVQRLFEMMFRGHAYGLQSLGSPESLAALSANSLDRWRRSHLCAENMLVTIVGAVETERAADLVESKLEHLDRCTEVPDPSRPPKAGQGQFVETVHKEQSALVLGFGGPGFLDRDYYAMRVLQNILTGLGGRLFEELRSRQSLAYTVSAFEVARRFAGTFLFYIATSPEKEEAARASLLRELRKISEELVSQQELTRSVRFTSGTYEIGLETNRAQMLQMAHCELLGKGWESVARFRDRITEVTAEEILQAVSRHFNMDSYCEAVIRGKS